MLKGSSGSGGGAIPFVTLLGGSEDDRASAVAIDSANNIVAVGRTSSDGAGDIDGLIVKYNTSGALQWGRTLGGTGTEVANGVAIDSADNIIVAGYTASDGAGGSDFLIAKYNSSGALQWDRTLGGTGSEAANGVAIDSADNIIVAGYTNSDGAGGTDALILAIAPDGSGTGSFGASLTYADAVLTDAEAVLTDAEAVLTDAVAVLTDAEAVLTDAEAVLTEEKLTLT